MEVRCANTHCSLEFGPAVGPTAIVSVRRRILLVENLLAVQCERCNHVTGDAPAPTSPVAQAILCPSCGRLSGEMYFGWSVFGVCGKGRVVWAQRALRIQCGYCAADWSPDPYKLPTPIVGAGRRQEVKV
jgi:hypothetical protein